MNNEIVTEVGDELGNAVTEVGSNVTDTVAQSGHNVFQTISEALGFDITKLSFSKILISVVLLVVLIMLSKLIGMAVYHAVKKSRLTEGLKKFIAKIARFICYFISLMIFADSIGIPITSLVAVFSLLGLAISLSIQNLLSNIMSGVSLLMLKPFDIGDFIETDVAGTVKNIGLFYTEIVTPDNKCVFIPNEKLIGDKLTNCHSEDLRRIDVSFNAGYDFEPEQVKTALRDAIDSVDMLVKSPEPIIGIAEYGDSAIIYDVRVWTKTTDFFPAKYALMDAVHKSYKKHGIAMAYNRLEVNVLNK